jgi:NAD(P)-dependent dehydrogenase (short-subunit alcohol dehydrogenase family)
VSRAAPALGSPASGVVITGAASGIGLESARALAAVGRAVALWDIDGDAASRAAAEISAETGVAAVALAVDLADAAAIPPAAAASRKAIGPIGAIVHSAGTSEVTGLAGVTDANWARGIDLHVRAILLLAQALRADLAARPGSAIVALASINAHLGNGLIPIYSAAKGAVLSLVRSLADELATDGIRVNAVSPGQIDTPIMAAAKAALPGHYERRIMLGRYGLPEEVASVVRFLLSDEAAYINAAEIIVDGGNVTSQRQ